MMRLLALCCCVCLSLPAAVQNGSAAPLFTLPTAQGSSVDLAALRGQVVVLEWVNYDCPFVRKHYGSGTMQALQAEARSRGVVWLSICSSAPGKQGHFAGAALTERIAREGADPAFYLIDADGAVGKAYAAKTTPHCFVIDASGVVRYQGAIDSLPSADPDDIPAATPYVAQAIAAVLAGEPVVQASSKPYGCSVKY